MRKLTTHCNRNHELVPENIYVVPKTGQRCCRTCRRITDEKHRNGPTYKKYQSDWMKNNRELRGRIARRWELRTLYNLTPEEYQKLYDSQSGVCAICKTPESAVEHRSGKKRELSIDHSHATNENRGLLCLFCNHALGNFKDSPELCRRAAEYLENPPARAILNA
jgi:hypothetical protein